MTDDEDLVELTQLYGIGPLSKKKYVPINLPQDMAEELKFWRKVFMICYPTVDVTYEFMIRGMLDCLKDIDLGVKEEVSNDLFFCSI